jgi:hypothetical protein
LLDLTAHKCLNFNQGNEIICVDLTAAIVSIILFNAAFVKNLLSGESRCQKGHDRLQLDLAVRAATFCARLLPAFARSRRVVSIQIYFLFAKYNPNTKFMSPLSNYRALPGLL